MVKRRMTCRRRLIGILWNQNKCLIPDMGVMVLRGCLVVALGFGTTTGLAKKPWIAVPLKPKAEEMSKVASAKKRRPLSMLDLKRLEKKQRKLMSTLNTDGFQKRQTAATHNPFVKSFHDMSVSELVLSGIVYHPKKKVALINGFIVEAGDKIANFTIIRVERKAVILRSADGVFRLSLRGRKK